MRLTFHGAVRCGLVLALAAGATACNSSDSGTKSDPNATVEISVMGLPVATRAADRAVFLKNVEDFQKLNPKIKITPTETQWDARGFAAKLAGGTAETLIRVPLTEPAGLIARKQVADVTAAVKQLGVWPKFDQKALQPMTVDGKVYGVPENMYALGLVYNRALFTQAGLNPDQPPKTWDEVRTAAKAIAEKTGVAGFADATTNNNGGWHLTAAVYSYGGTMEKEGDGGKMVAAFNDEPAKKYLQLLKDMRWTDNSMGTNHLRGYDDAIRDFATGKMGMLVFAPDLYNDYVVKYKGDPANLGVGSLPQAGGNATLVGGTIDMVNAKATKEQALAAMKWAEYQYLRRLSDPEFATTDAKARVADKRPVGLPTVPVFNQSTVDAIAAAVAPHVNVPTNNFKPFVEGTKGLTYTPEPPVAAQEVYAALDSAVQAILTNADADPAKELASAEDRVNSILKQRQQ